MNKQPKTKFRAKSTPKSNTEIILIQSAYRRYQDQKELQNRKSLFKRKTNIAQELQVTERTYLANLKILNNTFLQPLESVPAKILGDLQSNLHLLGSIVKVIISYHDVILQKIEDRLASWSPSTKLGDIFMEMSSFLKSYTQYVAYYQPILRVLRSRKDDAQLQKVLDGLVDKNCRGKGLKDFLIMPIQRIPRYNMMLEDLLKKTDKNHCDYSNLEDARSQVAAVCGHVEETSDHASRIEKKMELASRIIFPKEYPIVLAEPHRQFILEGPCIITTSFPVNKAPLLKKKVMFYVFSDLVTFCEESSRSDMQKAILTLLMEEIEMFRAVRAVATDESKTIMLRLENGEVKLEDLSAQQSKDLEQFFVDYAKNNLLPTGAAEAETRRTVQIKKMTSEMLPVDYRRRGRASTSGLDTSLNSIVVPDIKIERSSKENTTTRLKRTFSVGKFSKDRITKSVSKEELSSATQPTPTIVKSRTSERIRDLSDLMKRSNRNTWRKKKKPK